jgi:5,10-methenyltetrahydromethanopterin hydrogenase
VGIHPSEFWAHTWKENQLLGESFTIKQNLEWERLRYLATMVHNVNVDKKSQMVKPEKLIPLPQDVYYKRKKTVEVLPPEKVLEIVERMNKKEALKNS